MFFQLRCICSQLRPNGVLFLNRVPQIWSSTARAKQFWKHCFSYCTCSICMCSTEHTASRLKGAVNFIVWICAGMFKVVCQGALNIMLRYLPDSNFEDCCSKIWHCEETLSSFACNSMLSVIASLIWPALHWYITARPQLCLQLWIFCHQNTLKTYIWYNLQGF